MDLRTSLWLETVHKKDGANYSRSHRKQKENIRLILVYPAMCPDPSNNSAFVLPLLRWKFSPSSEKNKEPGG